MRLPLLCLAIFLFPACVAARVHALPLPLSHATVPAVTVRVVHVTGGIPVLTSTRMANKFTTTVELQASSTSALAPPSVSLVAFVDDLPQGVTVRIDGVELGVTPVTIAHAIPLGAVTSHRIEIEIPDGTNGAIVPSEVRLEFGAQTP